MSTHIYKISESDLFNRYRSTYSSAFIDCVVHTSFIWLTYHCIWMFRNQWLSIFPTIVLGLLLNRSFIVFHDCCHNSYTPSRSLNYILGTILGITTFTSVNWILDHHTHHLTNGNKENTYNFKFNELLYWNKKQYMGFSRFSKIVFSFFHTPIVFFTFFPFLYFVVIQRFIYIVKKLKYTRKIDSPLYLVILNHVINNVGGALLLTYMAKNGTVIQYLMASYIGYILDFLLFFNQHTYNTPYVVGNSEWTQRDSGLLGSSFIEIPSILKYFTMGIEYHHIHHMCAKIPGYHLRQYHDEVVSKSSMFDNIVKLSMTDCYRNLWLVMYDEDNNRYITIREAEEEISRTKSKLA
jgi:omega-6 fatty acid desaturase (delta-12 desaturase)